MSGLGAERERLAGEIASQRAELAEQRETLVSELAAERNRLVSEREAFVSELAVERQRLISELDERRAAWERQREEQTEEWARQQGVDMEALQRLRTETQVDDGGFHGSVCMCGWSQGMDSPWSRLGLSGVLVLGLLLCFSWNFALPLR